MRAQVDPRFQPDQTLSWKSQQLQFDRKQQQADACPTLQLFGGSVLKAYLIEQPTREGESDVT